MTIWFVLLSAGIKTSAFQMSKFRGSITLSIFSLSTLSNYHYWQSPKTRYWRLVRPYQTGIPPARLLALIWAHNSDLLLKSYHILKHISIPIVSAPIYCIAFRLASVPAGSLSARWQRKCQHGVWNFFRVVISVGAKRVPLALSTLCTPGRQNETPAAVPSACFPFCLFFKNPQNRILWK